MSTITLKCECGAVEGSAVNITPSSGNRVACCCSDCQSFVNHLGRGAQTLDRCGGTEIYQTSLSQVKIHHGHEHLRSLRLTPTGLLRWYTDCCKTPVANTMRASVPFIGLFHTFTQIEDRELVLGPIRAYCQTQHAIGEADHPKAHPKFPLGISLRILRQLITWKVQGKHKPAAFYTEDGKPIVKPEIVNG